MKQKYYSLLVMALMLATVVGSKAQTISTKRLIGIPFVSDADVPVDSARAIVYKQIKDRCPQLDRWNKQYDTLPSHKAVCIRYGDSYVDAFHPLIYRHRYVNTYVNAWGGGWGYANNDTAMKVAFVECKKNEKDKNYTYVGYMYGDSAFVPDGILKSYMDKQKHYKQHQISNLEKAERKVLINDSYIAVLAKQKQLDKPFAVFLKTPVLVGYPDREQDYSSACQDRVFYALMPSKGSEQSDLEMKLKKLEDAVLYNFYNRSVNSILEYKTPTKDRLMQKMCLFTNHFVFTNDPVKDSALRLPQNIEEVLHGEVIKEIWLEGAVRITDKGTPLVIDDYARPLAIKTDKGFYAGVEIKMPDEDEGCNLAKSMPAKIFTISVCLNDYACVENVQKTLLESLAKSFSAEPLGAEKIANEVFGPGELYMERQFKPSVLAGNSVNERSTYTLEAWVADNDEPWYSLYSRQIYKGVNKENSTIKEGKQLYLYLQVNSIVTLATGQDGSYKGPEQAMLNKYNVAVHSAVLKGIEDACTKLNGQMNYSICNLVKKP